MVFDLTNVDTTVVLQALYANAMAAGFGVVEDHIKGIEGLSLVESRNIIRAFDEVPRGGGVRPYYRLHNWATNKMGGHCE